MIRELVNVLLRHHARVDRSRVTAVKYGCASASMHSTYLLEVKKIESVEVGIDMPTS